MAASKDSFFRNGFWLKSKNIYVKSEDKQKNHAFSKVEKKKFFPFIGLRKDQQLGKNYL